MTCPACLYPLEVSGLRILDNGHPVHSCPWCLTALAVVGGEIVPDVTTEYEHIEVIEVTL
jgi:hypothetical protein